MFHVKQRLKKHQDSYFKVLRYSKLPQGSFQTKGLDDQSLA